MRSLANCAILLSALSPLSANAAQADGLDQPGMLVPCFFEQADKSKAGVAVFIPSTGVKDKALIPAQIGNPDGLLSQTGFDWVRIQNGVTEFSGKNEMTITFAGGEIYLAELRPEGGKKQSGTCVVLPAKGVTEAMANFAEFRQMLNSKSKDGTSK